MNVSCTAFLIVKRHMLHCFSSLKLAGLFYRICRFWHTAHVVVQLTVGGEEAELAYSFFLQLSLNNTTCVWSRTDTFRKELNLYRTRYKVNFSNPENTGKYILNHNES